MFLTRTHSTDFTLTRFTQVSSMYKELKKSTWALIKICSMIIWKQNFKLIWCTNSYSLDIPSFYNTCRIIEQLLSAIEKIQPVSNRALKLQACSIYPLHFFASIANNILRFTYRNWITMELQPPPIFREHVKKIEVKTRTLTVN